MGCGRAHCLLPACAGCTRAGRTAIDDHALTTNTELHGECSRVGAAIEPGSGRNTSVDDHQGASRLNALETTLRRGKTWPPARIGAAKYHVHLEAGFLLGAVEERQTAITMLEETERWPHRFDLDLQFDWQLASSRVQH